MVPLIFQMVCKKRHMTKLIARKKLRTHIISGEQKLTSNLFFISHSCILRDKNWQENKKISEHFAGQFANRTLKLYASSIRVGSNTKHVHTFGCPVFALQNALASGNQLPRWSPCTCLGLNLGPSPMHGRNVYLVLNLITGCVSPQYHCCCDNFFKTTRLSGPDVSGTICWQQLCEYSYTEYLCCDSAFAHKKEFSIFKFPEWFLEISCRDLTL
jgi:hypothetical protein